MMKAKIKSKDGTPLLMLGLSFGNLDRLRAHPMDSHIVIKGTELGIDFDIMIFSARTEQDMMEAFASKIGPSTDLKIGKGLKS